jgi:phage tail-like protein
MKGGTLLRVLAVSAVLAVGIAAAAWAALAASDDVTAARYSLIVDGSEVATFSEFPGLVSGLERSQLELTAGRALKLPGKRTPPTVTLKRGMSVNTDMWTWHEAALAGDLSARKDADLVMYATDGKPVARYHLENAWPSKVEIGGLKADSTEVLMETVTIVCEHIQRVSV